MVGWCGGVDGVWLCCGVRSGAVKRGCGNGAVKRRCGGLLASRRWPCTTDPMPLQARHRCFAPYVRPFPTPPTPFFPALFSSYIFFFSWLQRLLHRSYVHRPSSPTRLFLRLLCNRSFMHLLGWVSFLIFSWVKNPLDAIISFIIYLGLRI